MSTTTKVERPQFRILGPYPFGKRFRCQLVNGKRRTWLSPEPTAERAVRVADRLIDELTARQPVTIAMVIERYRDELIQRDNKPASYDNTPLRLRRFFGPVLKSMIAVLTERRCEELYAQLRGQASERTGQLIAAATHQAYLADARSFGRWLAKEKYVRTNPLADIRGVGKKRKGKSQLRIDEARRWLAKGMELATGEKSEPGAVAAMVSLLMGLRCSEIVPRIVRDLDDNGQLLWISDSKTEAGKRYVRVPKPLQPLLQRQARDKLPTAYLFPGKKGGIPDRAWPRLWVKRICEQAGVPIVCAHSMRGLHATLAIEAGVSPDAVAGTLGHESSSMTLSAYAAPGSAAAANASRLQDLLG